MPYETYASSKKGNQETPKQELRRQIEKAKSTSEALRLGQELAQLERDTLSAQKNTEKSLETVSSSKKVLHQKIQYLKSERTGENRRKSGRQNKQIHHLEIPAYLCSILTDTSKTPEERAKIIHNNSSITYSSIALIAHYIKEADQNKQNRAVKRDFK